jgi:hypothetical protein
MKRTKMSKVLFSIVSIFAIANVFAIPKGPCDTKQEVCCQDAQDTYAFSYPKDMGLACPRDFYANGDFLWMKPAMDGLEYALTNDYATTPSGFPLNNGVFKGFSTGSQEWDWRPGFRANVGFYSDFDAWNFDLAWTYMRIKANSSVTYSGSGSLLPLFLQPQVIAAGALNDASARWSGDFNTFDLSMGKPYHVSRYFVSNPMFGIRAAWIDQDYLVRYSLLTRVASTNVMHKNNFWGVGLRGAYKGEFLLGANWSIFAKGAFSLLFSKFDLSQSSDQTTSNYKMEDEFYTVKPNAELALGFSWGKFFNKNQYFASLKVGYEFHQWWDINQLRRFFDATYPAANDTVSRGDLSFNGFQFGFGLDF